MKTPLEYAQKLAGTDYEVSEKDGFVVAHFGEDWLSFETSVPNPANSAACLNWSVRTAMGQVVPFPQWMTDAGYEPVDLED